MTELRRTPLYDLHTELGARMVPYAGWEMPVQYPMGVMGEHLHTRKAAGLFDVSHMGQVILRGEGAAKALERLVPADIIGLAPGRQRYGLFTNEDGGILDDLMIAGKGDHLLLVVNASRAEADITHMTEAGLAPEVVTDRALLALQGPGAERALAALVPGVADLRFMDSVDLQWESEVLWVSRSGYTGEDGFEISIPAERALDFARALLAQEGVVPIGLGARDSLRLEAGLPLYGNDMDATVSPAQAGLGWSIPKVRRAGGARAGGFPGADKILPELGKAAHIRRGLRPEGRAPMREGTPIYAGPEGGEPVGRITSGGFGPSAGVPIAMATLAAGIAEGTTVYAELRGKRLPATVAPMPFVQPTYKR
ncbi:glycine cleavage system aminomethyltransferase GcvT [Paracoccus sp. MC1854]|uniref:glycine cleavage system aminomethyltransferase GcvT n=1 Tax=Paracoccus sp. MC1854 TaxID=2760306 RepID=UPI0016005941|nr:glycine cleavage system aminomethyltransferase GcvT [Paracoccus sp. MC1854]MBB1490278.1 glycine cleavage system aminomethyltransferase GcvT [Paracoccus sp. MC1854]